MIDWKRIDSLSDPEEQLSCFRLQLDFLAMKSIATGSVEFPIEDVVVRLRQLAKNISENPLTPESVLFSRNEIGQMTETLLMLLFLRHAPRSNDETSLPSVVTGRVLEEECGQKTWSQWGQVRELLLQLYGWIGKNYALRNFHHHLSTLPETEQVKFLDLKDQLSVFLSRSVTEPIQDKLEDFSSDPHRYIDELKRLRSIAWTDSSLGSEDDVNSGEMAAQNNNDSSTLVFVVRLSSSLQFSTYGLLIFHADIVLLWASTEWSTALDKWSHTGRSDNHDVQRLNQENTFQQLHQHPDHFLINILNKQGVLLDDQQHVQLLNLTRLNLPWISLLDPQGEIPMVNGISPTKKSVGNKITTLHFWGAYAEPANKRLTVNQAERTLRYATVKSEVPHEWCYPNIANKVFRIKPDSFLSGAYYDLWALEDVCKSTTVDLIHHSDDLTGTRAEFLCSQFTHESVLHFSTHGMAYDAALEFGNLRLARRKAGVEDCLHYFDVLSMDLTGVELVFLQACFTKTGRPFLSEEDFSLAWAFLAAGAKAVIATHWTIPDDSAWHFTQAFYTYWLCDQYSLPEAFRRARQELRMIDQPNSLRHWGGYSLIMNSQNG